MVGSMSQRQLRWRRMLNLSWLRAEMRPVERATSSPMDVTILSTQTGAVMRIHQGLPNALRIRLLKSDER